MRAVKRVLEFYATCTIVTRMQFPNGAERILNKGTASARAAWEMFEIQPIPVTERKSTLVRFAPLVEERNPRDLLAYDVPEEKRKRQERMTANIRARERRELIREMGIWHSRRTGHRIEQVLEYIHATDPNVIIELSRVKITTKYQGKKTRKAHKIQTNNGADKSKSQMGMVLSQLKRIVEEPNIWGAPKKILVDKLKPYQRETRALTQEMRAGYDGKAIVEKAARLCFRIKRMLLGIEFGEGNDTGSAHQEIAKRVAKCERIMDKCDQLKKMFAQQE